MRAQAMWIMVVLVVACGMGSPAGAHHSVAGVFDVSKTVKLSGTVSHVDWINPHTYIYIDVKDAQGEVTTWKLESLPVAMMRKSGITMQSLLGGGQHVVAEANPARNGTPAFGFVLKLTYDDGHTYQFGRSVDDKPVLVQ